MRDGVPLKYQIWETGAAELDVTHTLASYLSACLPNAALLADLSSETNALVLAAVTLPVLLRTKDTLAEQTFLFRLLGTR